ncbi:MAG: hypothetical protein FRX49_06018 [Trebouxia sp. A1-2]|nr:MAG: hypothetical protein FRX49_06018 [Trebouxia sp. A1-2]
MAGATVRQAAEQMWQGPNRPQAVYACKYAYDCLLAAAITLLHRHSGMKSATSTLVTVSSSLTATTRFGGHVTSAQIAYLTSGRLQSKIDQ